MASFFRETRKIIKTARYIKKNRIFKLIFNYTQQQVIKHTGFRAFLTIYVMFNFG
ncbi:MAG: hypothetical protein GY834_05195 [Bacteroidetes bacterium]|nr:hypothetical protein [Bacteroidota bacterium]